MFNSTYSLLPTACLAGIPSKTITFVRIAEILWRNISIMETYRHEEVNPKKKPAYRITSSRGRIKKLDRRPYNKEKKNPKNTHSDPILIVVPGASRRDERIKNNTFINFTTF